MSMDWKTLLRRAAAPPLQLALPLAVLCAAGLTGVFLRGWQDHPAAPVLYALSAYVLAVLVPHTVRGGRRVRRRVHAHPLGHRWLTDPAFRTRISLCSSLGVNLLHAAVNLFSGIRTHALWFYSLAGYHGTLSLMRFLLLRYVNHGQGAGSGPAGLRISRLCAGILLLMDLLLAGSVLLMICQDRGFDYPGTLIYAAAAYTFYSTISAICHLVKYRRYRSPVLSTAKAVSLAAALVSMLSLETAMLTRFGTGTDEAFRRLMIAATGGGVSLSIAALSICIIIQTTREIRREPHGITE